MLDDVLHGNKGGPGGDGKWNIHSREWVSCLHRLKGDADGNRTHIRGFNEKKGRREREE
jgi:hypothetical protein